MLTSAVPFFDTRRICADALADELGAQRPTDAVVADDQRSAQWSSRLVMVPHARTEKARAAALAEANLYSGHPHPPRPWPVGMTAPVRRALDSVEAAEPVGDFSEFLSNLAKIIEEQELPAAA